MDNGSFQLKRSSLALLFQLAVFTALMALLYQLLPLSLWCGFLALGAAAYLLFYRRMDDSIELFQLFTALKHNLGQFFAVQLFVFI